MIEDVKVVHSQQKQQVFQQRILFSMLQYIN
jgi:hypothetical protein